MRAIFIELPAFARHRAEYLDDDQFRALQAALMKQPTAGDVIKDTGGLRKLRFADVRRGKGKSGGLRHLLLAGNHFVVLAVHAIRQR